jgi:predicted  nucleic acid-binding Zn-ribbon protein
MAKKLTLEVILRRFHEVHGNRYGYPDLIGNDINKKISIKCHLHGDFIQSIEKHMYGQGCRECGIIRRGLKLRKPLAEFILEANVVHDNKYDYSKFIYVDSKTYGIIICHDHGEFPQFPGNHLMGDGCPECGSLKVGNLFRKSLEQFEIDSKIIHGELYDYGKFVYITAHIKGIITCRKCGRDFLKTPNAHLNLKRGCPHCRFSISVPETKFLDILKVPDDIEHRQKYIKPYKADGIKDNKIFEFLGDYWHGNPLKFNPTDLNNTTGKSYGYLYNNTIKKFKSLFDRNYTIYYMWEADYVQWMKSKKHPFPLKIFNPNKPI